MKRLIAAMLICLFAATVTTGCYHNQVIVSPNYNASQTEPDVRNGFQMYLLAGLIPMGDNPIDLAQVCPQGAGIVEVRQNFLNGLLNRLVGLLVSFQETSVYCAKAAADTGADTPTVAVKE